LLALLRRWSALVLSVLGFFGVVAWIVGIRAGSPAETLGRLVFVVQSLLVAGSMALAWLASAMGWGRLFRGLFREATHPLILQFACGVATLLWLDHATGFAGLLAFRPVAWGLAAIGLGLLVHQFGRTSPAVSEWARVPWTALLAVPPLAILATAASSAPGWLWDSEMFGFDTLEYHLELPAEWLAAGRLTSLHHNVYSCLPSYLEAAYLHLAAALGSVYAAGGAVLRAAQFLHAGLAVSVACMAGAFAARRLRGNAPGPTASLVGGLVVAAVLSPPYVQVDGSLANNEMAMCALLLAGLVAVTETSMSPGAKGAVLGWISGAAAGAKPTAIFMVAVPLALLLAFFPGRRRSFAAGAGLGSLALLPYWIRNAVGTGNPVFPFASRVFGLGPWSPEQLERWTAWHRFQGTLGDRISLAWTGGIAHPLWSIFFGCVLLAAVVAWAHRETRRLSCLLIFAILVQLVCWIALTHLLPRFLLPVLAPAGILIGLAVGQAARRRRSPAGRGIVLAAACLALVPMTIASMRNVAAQRGGDPARFIGSDAFDLRTGRYFVEHGDLRDAAPIEYATNYRLPEGSLVYFIGESRVLYAMGPKIYNTAWDRSALGDLMRSFPDAPALWARGLADRGVTHIRISMAELDRLERTDRISDPLVSLPVVERFLGEFGRPLARNGNVSALYELRAPPPAP
jgi:hypothetical protein